MLPWKSFFQNVSKFTPDFKTWIFHVNATESISNIIPEDHQIKVFHEYTVESGGLAHQYNFVPAIFFHSQWKYNRR